jgi:hypothetical protein
VVRVIAREVQIARSILNTQVAASLKPKDIDFMEGSDEACPFEPLDLV